jgi:hypothetical protein
MTTSDPDLLDEIDAHARRSDPQTSHDAARRVDVKGHRRIVLALLAVEGPCTADHLEDVAARARLGITPASIRSRRVELQRLGLVIDTGTKAATRTGCQATVWAVAA